MSTKPGEASAPRSADHPLQRLGAGKDDEAFLQAHHLLAAERLMRLVDRARLTPRVTMSYDPARVGGGRGGGNAALEMSDAAADARKRLGQIAAAMPGDCWGVVIDVCGFSKGLQTVETERQWPRRSAKLVLRIGLEQLARLWGLSGSASGPEQSRARGWLAERLPLIGEEEEAGR
ncbi:DUF6456 domain-containing protein [Devosia sp. 1566]|uniref:DUF6456 domain-containing protein n=1 Tax=Devosia sp. 1566 TaxID=2499144 RepID=UPI000FD75874|nr:DUF6456 domain-containing protein [Devosia sp. 1566]